jgi:hypothetical protein
MNAPKISLKRAEWLKRINWIGVIAGILMIALPFAGPWWRVTVGTGALEAATSPFGVNITALGQPVESTLTRYICLGVSLLVIIAGLFLLLASLLPDRWWSKRLMRFGSTRVLWMVILFLVLITLMALVANKLLVGMVPELEGFSVPYISGSTTSTLHVNDVTVTLPITLSLAWPFAMAILTAILALAARIYHRRFVGPPQPPKA